MVLVFIQTYIKMNNPWHLYIMAGFYAFAGIMHFVKPKAFMRIMPRFLPKHKLLVHLSGIAEIILSIMLCIPEARTIAIYLIVIMLLLFLPVHLYMLSSKKAGAGFPKWLLILRVPLQFVLMHWAYWYL